MRDWDTPAKGVAPEAELLRAIRLGLELSRPEFARRFGLSVTTPRLIEEGRVEPRVETVERVLKSIGRQLRFCAVGGVREFERYMEAELLSTLLRWVWEVSGVRQREWARRAGIDWRNLNGYVCARQEPSFGVARRLLNALGWCLSVRVA